MSLATGGRGTKGVKVTKDCYVHAYMHVVLSKEGKKCANVFQVTMKGLLS